MRRKETALRSRKVLSAAFKIHSPYRRHRGRYQDWNLPSAKTGIVPFNDEAQNPRACGVALVMFTFGEPRAHKTMQGKSIDIVQVTIHAYGDGIRWLRVPATQE